MAQTHYHTYGGTLTQSTNQGVQKYKYNGKEFDRTHGLNMYDFGARQLDPTTGLFTSMDPLCEKYYNISPYSYCAGNPIRYVDPDGRDIWTLNNIGEIQNYKKDDKIDRIQMENGVNIDFEYGTISGPTKNENNNLFSVKGDNAGTSLFEFLAFNVAQTSTEVGLLRTGKDSSGQNYIGVSPTANPGHEQTIAQCINDGTIDTKIGVREYIHSHPGGTVTPSGMPEANNKGGDWKGMLSKLQKWPNCKFELYIPMQQTCNPEMGFYIPYSKESKLSDFQKYENKIKDIINQY